MWLSFTHDTDFAATAFVPNPSLEKNVPVTEHKHSKAGPK